MVQPTKGVKGGRPLTALVSQKRFGFELRFRVLAAHVRYLVHPVRGAYFRVLGNMIASSINGWLAELHACPGEGYCGRDVVCYGPP